ncbi:MAG: hypothetical protein RLZZ546_3017 [Bacteroidota bacterium]|jgi:type 1 glutamine amidotransferase
MIRNLFIIAISVLSLLSENLHAQKQFSILLYTKTNGWHHASIKDGIEAIFALSQRHHFDVDFDENTDWFTDENLKKYDAIIFLNTTGDILNDKQQAAMERFIRSGKGFVGIHSASDTEYDWEWYTKLVGRMFVIHPSIQTAYLNILNRKFPGLEDMHDKQIWTDEFYEFSEEKSKGLNYIISIDENTYNPNVQWGSKIGKGMGNMHPIAWYQYYDGGRSFYSALGHLPDVFRDEKFLSHIYGGIYWAATGKGVSK